MIVGLGTDIIEIERFARWHTYFEKRLAKIFSADEIAYCLATPELAAQRFAVRFAAKEALYKALSTAGAQVQFFTLCNAAEITKVKQLPLLQINWLKLGLPPTQVHLSLSHNKTMAQAVVVLESAA